jgi:RHH-type proline utilization regulon transcriptional repressor/proline dehydrogenase/delta 1-pyrroline-5-carboxylate dehydrogenase
VILEMGGKNAVIVDDDADLDEAVPEIIRSAFGYQGQKCSACSRLIVVQGVYDRLVARMQDACAGLRLGPPEDPGNFMGAVIDETARRRILRYIEQGKREGRVLAQRMPPEGGHTVPLTILTDIDPASGIAREEIFGPVLVVLRAESFSPAVEMANQSEYALTGSVFSRSPAHIAEAERDFLVGNLYINRRCTGAVVGRHPFGGFKMSGVGSKAGGPDYLLQFMVSRNVAENTFRKGFAGEGDP